MSWLESIEAAEVAFCRVTQMGMLRLLTNQTVMGTEVLSSSRAWQVYRTMLADERVQFAPEPFSMEQEWRKLTSQSTPSPNVWTDAYLAAFARAGGMQLVTFDRAMPTLAPEALLLGS